MTKAMISKTLMVSGTISATVTPATVIDFNLGDVVSMQVISTGTLAGTVHLQGSMDGQHFSDIGTVTLAGANLSNLISFVGVACPYIGVSVTVTAGSSALQVFVGLK